MFQYVKHRGGLEEVEARWFFQQLIIGMDYCHKMVCLHLQIVMAIVLPLSICIVLSTIATVWVSSLFEHRVYF